MDFTQMPRSNVATGQTPRKPQGGTHAQLIGRGRVWVESINSLKGTAIVRFYCGDGFRSKVQKVALASLDFGTIDGWRTLRTKAEA